MSIANGAAAISAPSSTVDVGVVELRIVLLPLRSFSVEGMKIAPGWHALARRSPVDAKLPGLCGDVVSRRRKVVMQIVLSSSGSVTVVGIRGSVDGLTADDL